MYDQPTTTEIDPSKAGFRIDPVLARSWLLVNGAQYGKFAGGPLTCRHRRPRHRGRRRPKDKTSARDNVIRWLGSEEGRGDWVRVNGFGTPWWADDLAALSQVPVGGVMLAMVESPDHVTGPRRGCRTPIVALVETAARAGTDQRDRVVEEHLPAGVRHRRDFRRDTGFGGDPLTLAYARSRFTIAAKAAHLPSAIDGPDRRVQYPQAERGHRRQRRVRYDRQDLSHPDQCHPVNEGLSPAGGNQLGESFQ